MVRDQIGHRKITVAEKHSVTPFCHGYNRAIRKFKRVMMDVPHTYIDLTEPGYFGRRGILSKIRGIFITRVGVKHDLGSRHKAHGRTQITLPCESTGYGVVKVRGNQSIAHDGLSRGHVFKTVITHVTPPWPQPQIQLRDSVSVPDTAWPR